MSNYEITMIVFASITLLLTFIKFMDDRHKK